MTGAIFTKFGLAPTTYMTFKPAALYLTAISQREGSRNICSRIGVAVATPEARRGEP